MAAIVGPTAVGKTSLAIKVARKIQGEILSCDSMQVYKKMDIGTAKATPIERQEVAHHLIDVVDINNPYSVADYQCQAQQLIWDLNQVGKLPILVGGTGLYYQAVVDQYQFFPMVSQQKVRRYWQERVKYQGLEKVYKHLESVDPGYAAKISSHDEKRIIRALEVYELTGKPFSSQQKRQVDRYNLVAVGLYLEREQLYDRINRRVDLMLEQGLIDEVKGLWKQGYDLRYNAMQALGYKQVLFYLEGFVTFQDMVEEIKRETRRYAKRQYTWFKRDKRIVWIDVGRYSEDEMVEKIYTRWEGQLYAV
ncbi:tRNA (adenosine(37)-N6)-dimethylallyltransferase MiaA [Syntrophomonas erecta]